MARKKRNKRGHPVALLVSFDEKEIHLWRIFSHSLRNYKTIKLKRKWKYSDEKQKYHYFEDTIDALRPIIKEGMKSILLAAPAKEEFSSKFMEHLEKHHRWLLKQRRGNQVSFGQVVGVANDFKQANYLMNKQEVSEMLDQITADEADLIIKHLEKSINIDHPNAEVIYGLEHIEDFIYRGGKKDTTAGEKVDFLVLNETYLSNHSQKGRVHRLMQIARNKGIKVKIISEESESSSRIKQFGGIICFKKVDYSV